MRQNTPDTTLRRRRLLGGGIAAGALLAATSNHVHSQSAVTLTLAVWGGQAEQDGFTHQSVI